MDPIATKIAEELNVPPQRVAAAIALLDEGATVPFIARYRKEVTGGLDDTQLRTLEERLHYLRELEQRRAVILQSIADQGKLTEPLEAAIRSADTKIRIEDLYLPYKPKRRTKAQIAREAGLAPLAEALLSNPEHEPETLARCFVDPEKGVPDTKSALEGARHILMEDFAEEADLLGWLREHLWRHGMLCARVIEGREQAGLKFQDYFDYREPIRRIPSHRALALFRGRNEQVLQLELVLGDEKKRADSDGFNRCEKQIAAHFGIGEAGRPADAWLLDVVRRAWRVKISLHLEVELMMRLREAAEEAAIEVFAANLKDLLMAAPAGSHVTMGLDPGLRTGVKVAVVDATGKLVAYTTVYPHPPKNQWDASIHTLAELIRQHEVAFISIGNGTGSRETDKLAADLIAQHPEWGLTKVMVSEAGASVYSASAIAAQEFPDLDVVFRGAVSIARRLQDPLAELVKIDPKSMGVGQYQHDVRQSHLTRSLDTVVEDCVNAVGVAVNTASIPLLTHVSGLNEGLARNIVAHRDQHGPFRNREGLKSVPRLGPKTFEQSAGFLRIPDGDHPLDASAVHPEAYPLVKRILTDARKDIRDIIGDQTFLKALNPERYSDATFGLPTVVDIIRELEKPGRDPRPEFHTAQFKEGVETLQDLREGMILEGVVTNVTHFGAFVDIGVHQDGLAHISELANRFVKDPRDVVKTGDIVRVRVLKVDPVRRRIGLSMRLDEGAE
ncbi:MAG: RNA-binding transcriptional accessory protein [Candidatus Latescibacteria bacterium 4484_107]|nr:MAG: RNA-binding transcriptional accessory protein [Candidatus Latescibacteria bacterium 4484_107]